MHRTVIQMDVPAAREHAWTSILPKEIPSPIVTDIIANVAQRLTLPKVTQITVVVHHSEKGQSGLFENGAWYVLHERDKSE